jgi:hypothetical protein
MAALALAAPVAEASAATSHAVQVRAAVNPQPLSSVERSAGRVAVANAPTLIGDVFNGGTTIVTSPSPAVDTTIDSA